MESTFELVKGAVYRIRLTSGEWTDGRFLHTTSDETAYYTRHRRNTHFIFENVRTGRTIEIKSRRRIR